MNGLLREVLVERLALVAHIDTRFNPHVNARGVDPECPDDRGASAGEHDVVGRRRTETIAALIQPEQADLVQVAGRRFQALQAPGPPLHDFRDMRVGIERRPRCGRTPNAAAAAAAAETARTRRIGSVGTPI